MSDTSALTSREVVADAVDVLRDGDVILGGGEIDYAAADLLEVLVALHDATVINLEQLNTIREFARLVIEGWDLA